MNKRIIILVLLLLPLFFCSCSTMDISTTIKTKKVTIPDQSIPAHEEYEKEKQKKEKEVDPKQAHYNRQSDAVKKAMKKNEKMCMKNTPVRKKKKFCNSPFGKSNRSCGNRYDSMMMDDGVSDVRQ